MIDLADPFLHTSLDDEFFIYATSDLIKVLIGADDMAWAQKWLWSANWNRDRMHLYIRRGSSVNGRKRHLYLHKEIMKRQQPVPPDAHHTIADHIDGDTLNCRRDNLRWATPRMNTMNNKRSRTQHV